MVNFPEKNAYSSKKGIIAPTTHYRSFQRWVFPVSCLHWYWQHNQNNQETKHTHTKKNTK